MQPIDFKEKTTTLGKPNFMTDEQCGSLSVRCDGETCLSCWRPSFSERLSILFFGKVWLWVFSGASQPPVALEGKRKLNLE